MMLYINDGIVLLGLSKQGRICGYPNPSSIHHFQLLEDDYWTRITSYCLLQWLWGEWVYESHKLRTVSKKQHNFITSL